MPHHRQHLPDLAEILRLRGASGVVVSPGSRNAPLIDAFHRSFGEGCLSVVDERSAAFVALGLARAAGRPAILICSSGSAVLNYAPALAEARHQRVPLIALTADRPPAWIDQQDNQTLRQEGVFGSLVRRSLALPAAMHTEDELWFAHRLANEAYNASGGPEPGPVHLNIPLEEPLYTELPPPSARLRLVEAFPGPRGGTLPRALVEAWGEAPSILIVHGQDRAPSPAGEALARLARDPRVAVIGENLSNLDVPGLLRNPELALALGAPPAPPALLINSGGQVVSKLLKRYLRRAEIRAAWRVGPEEGLIDTYQQLSAHIVCAPEELYEALAALPPGGGRGAGEIPYGEAWARAGAEARGRREAILAELPFCDLVAVGMTVAALSPGSILELGNSTTVRNAQFFDPPPGVDSLANRGVSGIDGSLSTAVGTALATGRPTLCVLGDLAFLYDSNALWNRALPRKLRVAVVNNGGGGIFGLIGAPLERLAHRDLIEAPHPARLEGLAAAFGLRYLRAEDREGLAALLPGFLDPEAGPALLEIRTDPAANPGAYRRMTGQEAR